MLAIGMPPIATSPKSPMERHWDCYDRLQKLGGCRTARELGASVATMERLVELNLVERVITQMRECYAEKVTYRLK